MKTVKNYKYVLALISLFSGAWCSGSGFGSLNTRLSATSSSIEFPAYNNEELTRMFNKDASGNNFGFDKKANVSLSKQLSVSASGNSFVSRLHVKAATARGLKLKFKNCRIYDKVTVSIYDKARRLLMRFKDRSRDGNIATDILWTNEVIVECEAENEMYLKSADVDLEYVTYVFNRPLIYDAFFAPLPVPGPGGSCSPGWINLNGYCYYDARIPVPAFMDNSLSCFTDAKCVTSPEQYCKEIRSTILMSVISTWIRAYSPPSTCTDDTAIVDGFFTGVIVNNTRNDMIPYILTAGHGADVTPGGYGWSTCGGGASYVRTQLVFPEYWTIHYNYQRPICDTSLAGNYLLYTTGVDILYVNNLGNTTAGSHCSPSDIALLRVKDNPNSDYDIPVAYDVYFAGFNRTVPALNDPINFVSHPKGALKKLVPGYVYNSGCGWSSVFNVRLNNGAGALQSSMSGSPAFDANSRIRGILTNSCGFLDVCATSSSAPMVGGVNMFTSCVWNYIKVYLDPDNTNPTSIDGYDPLADCRDTVDIYGTLYPASTWRTENEFVISAASTIISPPANLECLIRESPTYSTTKQPYQDAADYIFKSGFSITLRPGFKAEYGNHLTAMITSCSTYTVCSGGGYGTGFGKTGPGHHIRQLENDPPEKIAAPAFHGDKLNIYPNPSNGELVHLLLPTGFTNGLYNIAIYDVNSKEVLNTSVTIDLLKTDLHLPALHSGIYTVILSNGAISVKGKFIIAK